MRISDWSSVVCSSDLSAVRRGVLLAFLASLVQALSALLLVAVLAVLLDMAGAAVRDWVAPLESASYALVVAVGLWLLSGLLRRGRHQGHGHGHDHDHDAGRDPDHSHGPACGHHPVPDPAADGRAAQRGALGQGAEREGTHLNPRH